MADRFPSIPDDVKLVISAGSVDQSAPGLLTGKSRPEGRGKGDRYACQPCGQRFLSCADLVRHVVDFHCCKKLRERESCEETFEVERSVDKQYDEMCDSNEIEKRLPSCDTCDDSFEVANGKKELGTVALDVAHDSEGEGYDSSSETKPPVAEPETDVNNAVKKKPRTGETCGSNFKSTYILKNHIAVVHNGERLHKCDICDLTFGCSGTKKRHTLLHSGVKNHRCELCDKTFTTAYSLKKHLSIHTGDKPYMCHQCDRCFVTGSYLKDHVAAVHSGEKAYICEVCSSTFATVSNLNRHRLGHSAVNAHGCENCGKAFSTKSNLKYHAAMVHGGENRRMHACQVCGKLFGSIYSLRKHGPRCKGEKPHSREDCENGQVDNLASNCHELETNVNTDCVPNLSKSSVKQYVCAHCNISFVVPQDLNAHVLGHEKMPKEFVELVCQLCDAKFKQNADLVSHLEMHVGNALHHCVKCDEKFLLIRDLHCHVRSKHPEVAQQSFKCQQCSKAFSTPRKLTEHVRVHTGEKPYKCDYCSLCFTVSSNLKAHQSLKHPGFGHQRQSKLNGGPTSPSCRGYGPHLCPHCGKSFASRMSYHHHKRLHTGIKPFVCQHCGQAFRRSWGLTQHLRQHTGEMRYRCLQCDKGFIQSAHLKSHMAVHSGREKNFECPICSRRFSQSGELQKHVQRHSDRVGMTNTDETVTGHLSTESTGL